MPRIRSGPGTEALFAGEVDTHFSSESEAMSMTEEGGRSCRQKRLVRRRQSCTQDGDADSLHPLPYAVIQPRP
jgi:hypothetical protein